MLSHGTYLKNRYRIQETIKQGGMSTVYRAHDASLEIDVAIKATSYSLDPQLRNAFMREADLLKNLSHPALPAVIDDFAQEGELFIVMQHIPGKDLAEALGEKEGGLAPVEVLSWADQLLGALEYLHGFAPPIIHRDIKPGNLKLKNGTRIMLLDFGLAKGGVIEHAQNDLANNSIPGYTRTYAPPEQLRATGTGPPSDLYALGATLYHLLTGQRPPDALNRSHAVFVERAPDPIRPAHEVCQHVPRGAAQVLLKAMELDASRRFATAGEMRLALRRAAEEDDRTIPNLPLAHGVSKSPAPGERGEENPAPANPYDLTSVHLLDREDTFTEAGPLASAIKPAGPLPLDLSPVHLRGVTDNAFSDSSVPYDGERPPESTPDLETHETGIPSVDQRRATGVGTIAPLVSAGPGDARGTTSERRHWLSSRGRVLAVGGGVVLLLVVVASIVALRYLDGQRGEADDLLSALEHAGQSSYAGNYLFRVASDVAKVAKEDAQSVAAKLAEAEARHGQAARLFPDNAEYQFNWGASLLAQGQNAAAEAPLSRAAQLNAENSTYQELLGDSLFRQGKYLQAEEAYKQAIRLRPGQAAYHEKLGDAFRRQNNKANCAQAEYQRASALNPALARLHFKRAGALAAIDHYREAAEEGTRALSLEPDNKEYAAKVGDWRKLVVYDAGPNHSLPAGQCN